MIKSSITLNHCFARKIALEAHPDANVGTRFNTRCELEFGQNVDDPKQWQVILSVHLDGVDNKPAPYKGCIEYVGIFSIDGSSSEEKVQRLIAVNCPALLYSSVREMVALLTGRGPHRALTLPTVSFSDGKLVARIEKPSAVSKTDAAKVK